MKLVKITVAILIMIPIILLNPLSMRILTVHVAKRQGVNTAIFYRLIKAESSFHPFARSAKGAIGLGQLKPETAQYMNKNLEKKQLYNPLTNLNTAAVYYKYLLKRYHENNTLALAAYNWGETNVDMRLAKAKTEWNKNTDFAFLFSDIKETNHYLKKIIKEK